MNSITQKMREHYSNVFDKFGANIQGVDWGGENDEKKLKLRYQKMLEVVKHTDMTDSITILDVGCGYGGWLQYALEKGYSFRYTGIDVCENMIRYASSNNEKGSFICGDIFEYESEQKYDFVICNGILTQKFGISIKEMDEYARALIKRMWDFSVQGIVFNVMKSQVDFMNKNLYYKSPLEIMGYCMTLTDKFVIDCYYPLYEYSVYLYKI